MERKRLEMICCPLCLASSIRKQDFVSRLMLKLFKAADSPTAQEIFDILVSAGMKAKIEVLSAHFKKSSFALFHINRKGSNFFSFSQVFFAFPVI